MLCLSYSVIVVVTHLSMDPLALVIQHFCTAGSGFKCEAHVGSVQIKDCHPLAETSKKAKESSCGVNMAKMAPCLLVEVAVSLADDSSWQLVCCGALLLQCCC